MHGVGSGEVLPERLEVRVEVAGGPYRCECGADGGEPFGHRAHHHLAHRREAATRDTTSGGSSKA
ncbi:MAG: hypothetical protein HOY79_47005 [Streptomyces sp.]|nr:hypothetical protein [Streptomyces sp.]